MRVTHQKTLLMIDNTQNVEWPKKNKSILLVRIVPSNPATAETASMPSSHIWHKLSLQTCHQEQLSGTNSIHAWQFKKRIQTFLVLRYGSWNKILAPLLLFLLDYINSLTRTFHVGNNRVYVTMTLLRYNRTMSSRFLKHFYM